MARRRWVIVWLLAGFVVGMVVLLGGYAFDLPVHPWIVCAAILAGQLMSALAQLSLVRDVRAAKGRLCSRCCYDLTGLPDSGSCPECGTSYDPDTLKRYWGSMAAKRSRGEQSSPPRSIP
ncbi:MAG: hypothetical protein AMXMBFR77_08280 [Phycisphaerales bacterium]